MVQSPAMSAKCFSLHYGNWFGALRVCDRVCGSRGNGKIASTLDDSRRYYTDFQFEWFFNGIGKPFLKYTNGFNVFSSSLCGKCKWRSWVVGGECEEGLQFMCKEYIEAFNSSSLVPSHCLPAFPPPCLAWQEDLHTHPANCMY